MSNLEITIVAEITFDESNLTFKSSNLTADQVDEQFLELLVEEVDQLELKIVELTGEDGQVDKDQSKWLFGKYDTNGDFEDLEGYRDYLEGLVNGGYALILIEKAIQVAIDSVGNIDAVDKETIKASFMSKLDEMLPDYKTPPVPANVVRLQHPDGLVVLS